MNRRSKIVMLVTLGVASAFTLLGVGCELLVTFPASEITEGGTDCCVPDTSTPDVQEETTEPHDAAKDSPSEASKDAADGGVDAPSDGEAGADAPTDSAVDHDAGDAADAAASDAADATDAADAD